tara:strand:+ start:688 stop:1449 length:762 start_codon:yes stop_codon:yes gene_type:complete
MGIYLGATELSTGGGGGGFGQTITVGDYAYPNARSLTDWFNADNYNAWNPSGRALMSHLPTTVEGSYVSVLSNNTYTTVADITSATNGGALINLAMWASTFNANASPPTNTTYKITIDGGTPVELGPFTNPSAPAYSGYSWLQTIGYWDTRSIVSSDGSTQSFKDVIIPENVRDPEAAEYKYSNYDATNDGFYYQNTSMPSNIYYEAYARPVDNYMQKGVPYVYFATSCKIEINSNQQGFSNRLSGVANIKLF